MKAFAHIPGVQYPSETPEIKPPAVAKSKGVRAATPSRAVRIDERNISTVWLRKNGLRIKVVKGARMVVEDK